MLVDMNRCSAELKQQFRGTIFGIHHDGEYLTDPIANKNLAASFFQQLLTVESVFLEDIDRENLEDGLIDEDWQSLCIMPTLEEVQAVVFSIKSDSVAGPDGFGVIFFHTCWDVISKDVFGTVTEFFHGVEMPKVFTSTTISPIPKTASPASWSEHRPISLCNVTNKICTKLMTIRLGRILPKVLSLLQSGFVLGRLLSDNVLLAQELIHSLKSLRPKANVVFKIDMAKAYDRRACRVFPLDPRLTARGSSLFPALFVLAADYLSRGLDRLFTTHQSMYYQAPGRIQTQIVQNILGYQLKHLGVPLYKGNRKACLFDSIILRLRYMLQGWAMTNLSHGGMLAFIKSVLQATPLHLLQAEACFSVEEGGLGVRSLVDYVRAFFMKLLWPFRSSWLRLCRIRNVVKPFIFWTLGDGSVSFWHDNYLREKRLVQLLHGEDYTMESVNYYWHEGDWNVPGILQTVPIHVAEVICQIPIAAGQGDKIVWTGLWIAAKYHGVPLSTDRIILKVQRHLRTLAHCRLAVFGACPGTRSNPLGSGGGCNGSDPALTVQRFLEVGGCCTMVISRVCSAAFSSLTDGASLTFAGGDEFDSRHRPGVCGGWLVVGLGIGGTTHGDDRPVL
ncbi:UNVERIFIED_CONTAM: hypothetical protein Scaly_2730200 [Sesamum calycinum]|uniref:Reverse transcriptase domain-containing protein n=1 Tax=Sesamum calycinum TaxID=2727403 RepID=A0AAW2J232_9LAMI